MGTEEKQAMGLAPEACLLILQLGHSKVNERSSVTHGALLCP